MTNGEHIFPTLKINCFLILSISLGLKVTDIRAPFILNDERVIFLFAP